MIGIGLRLLGGFESRAPDGKPLDIPPKKARALLAYLGVQLGKPVPRELVSGLIWGDVSADEQARRSLRQALTTLRRALPDGALETGRDEILLCASADVDVLRFEHAARQEDRASLEHALELYGGELLEGFMAHADGFDAWCERERRRLTTLAADSMQRLCELQRAQDDPAASMATAMRLVATDPVREAAHRLLMELYAEAGRASEAVRQFNVLRALLSEKLGTTPDARTTDLLERIRRSSERRHTQQAPPSSRATAASAPELRHACVLAIAPSERSFDAALERDVEVILARFGGSLMRVGEHRALGVFGFPRAHDDDLERGVRAALSLERLDTLAGRVTIGLASGPLLVEYTAGKPVLTGDVLGRASELSEAEGFGVLLTVPVVRALGERLESRPAASQHGARWATRYLDAAEVPCRTPLVGRRYELAQLTQALELCAESRRGRTFLVRGEAGVGKTRLLRALGEIAPRKGFVVHARSLVDFGDDAQGPPVQSILRELLAEEHRPGAPLPAASSAELMEESDFALLLETVREVGSEGAAQDHGGRELFLRKRRAASGRLLAARSTHTPRLVVIEDIHWADAETLASLGAWIEIAAQHPLVLVLTTRIEGEPEASALQALVRGRPVTTLDLAPLSPEEARELIQALDPGDTPNAEIVLARTGGNPLFIEQLVRFPQPNRVPASISSLVQARTDQLGAEDRALLQAAAVLGQSFTLPALSHLSERAEPALAGLIAQSLISERTDGYRFVHALVRDAVYGGLPEERRGRLHASAARYYAGRDAALHAEHLDRAGDADAAAAYVRAAGIERRAGNLERALELCDRGRARAERSADRHAASLLHGELSLELGRCEASLPSFAAAEASAGDAGGRARALVGRAAALRVLDRAQEALLALASAESLLDPQRDTALLSRIHYLRGNVLFPLGDWAACLESQSLALEAAHRSGSALGEAQALSGIADAHYLAGRWRTAKDFYARCEQVSRQFGALDLELTSRTMHQSLEAYDLDFYAASSGCHDVAERARSAGSLRAETVARVSAAWSWLVLGDWSVALSESSRAVAVADGIGAQRFSALGLAYAAIAHERLGERAVAQAELERALSLARSSGMRFSGVTVYAALLATAEEERIPALLDQADSVIRAGCFMHALVTFGIHGVEAAMRVGDAERARRYADELDRSMSEDPHALGRLVVDYGRTLSAWSRSPRAPTSRAELDRLSAALRRANMRSTLRFVQDSLTAVRSA